MKIIQHETYETMFYLEWDDGSRSTDFYNKTRAKDLLKIKGIENAVPHLIYDASKTQLEARGEVLGGCQLPM